MNISEKMAGLSGLEQLQALLATGEKPPIGETLQFEPIEFDKGRAVFRGVPGIHAYNPIGSVHGGYAATLLDSACGCAVHTQLSPTQAYTTLELKVAYHRGMTTATGPVTAEGRVLSMGKRVAFTEAKLTDDQGRLLASATSTLLVFERNAS
ncbi:MAG: thioesterase [Nevskia sp.]|nr:thioesterase [Nevskia sp.]